jgi:hypothetical protein
VFTTITVPGATTTNCFGINDQTQISGNYNDSRDGLNYGFMYDHGVFTTLNPPGSIDRSTFGINDNGHIVGYYVDTDIVVHNFVATPVVVDMSPPLITVAASPETLWPPNGQRVTVTVSGTITDEPCGLGVSSAVYQVIDEYGQIQPSGSLTLVDGQYTFTVALEASRRGNDRDGRRYTITVSATDQAGNRGDALTLVIVPHG